MIAPPNTTSETMLRAIAYTIAALTAAAELDIDRSDEDRNLFTAERTGLETLMDKLIAADQALNNHLLKESVRLQTRVLLGDAVLDRGVRAAKQRMK
ncbi:MAG: hypothetical protein AB1489_36020, partial [Acidobacteriota bacterium]